MKIRQHLRKVVAKQPPEAQAELPLPPIKPIPLSQIKPISLISDWSWNFVPKPVLGERIVIVGIEKFCWACSGGTDPQRHPWDTLGGCYYCQGTGKVGGYKVVRQVEWDTEHRHPLGVPLWTDIEEGL